jgi:hypothetical protein
MKRDSYVKLREPFTAGNVLLRVEKQLPNIGERVSKQDIEELVQFAREYIVDEPEVLDYVAQE